MKILFLAPAFFNYEQKIKAKMQRLGMDVAFYDERSVVTAFDRAVLKLFPALYKSRTYKYYDKIIKKHQYDGFNYIVIVKCDMVSEKILQVFRNVFPKAKLCLHLWDSVKNIKGIIPKIPLFDRATSFDRTDCSNIDNLHFRPLFFADDFTAKKDTTNWKYDLCFCGTTHSDRYEILNKLEVQAKELGLSFYRFEYLQSNFIYWFYKLFNRGFKKARKSDFAFEKKSLSELAEIENSSRVIVDIQHPNQTGLTMRTIEMLGMGKKLITTNADIKNYDFYNPANICVIDRKNPKLDKAFFETPYEKVPDEIYNKYSLEQWVKDVLGIEGDLK